MVEFGEKIKKLREEKGITQQTLAEHLYVTRQAVSRWECGARYPDILTTKKIAEVLGVTIDELVSGEELKREIEKEAVLALPVPNAIQNVIYAFGLMSYMLMCLFSMTAFLMPKPELAGTPAGNISLITISAMLEYVLNFIILLIGICASVLNKLSSKKVGLIMASGYIIRFLQFMATYIDMNINHNGTMGLTAWIEPAYYLVAAALILIFFCENKRVTPFFVYMISFLSVAELVSILKKSIIYCTGAGFAVRLVHLLAAGSLAVLLFYQAYVLDKKRRMAVRI